MTLAIGDYEQGTPADAGTLIEDALSLSVSMDRLVGGGGVATCLEYAGSQEFGDRTDAVLSATLSLGCTGDAAARIASAMSDGRPTAYGTPSIDHFRWYKDIGSITLAGASRKVYLVSLEFKTGMSYPAYANGDPTVHLNVQRLCDNPGGSSYKLDTSRDYEVDGYQVVIAIGGTLTDVTQPGGGTQSELVSPYSLGAFSYNQRVAGTEMPLCYLEVNL